MQNRIIKSNGYGLFEQQIMLRVQNNNAQQAQELLHASVCAEADTHTELLWKRKTTTLRDDEDIVFEADMLLHELSGNWQIVWERSVY